MSKMASRLFVWMLALLLAAPMQLAAPVQVAAQDEPSTSAEEQPYLYSQEQLDSLLAPIALYPDVLLSQILMASTYPLEVVEADRWLKENPSLSGEGLDTALMEKPWDVSVKSLCHFPRVLASMSQDLEETNDLGNAFLSQQDQVMDTIQRLRATAQAEGNLRSNDRERVTVEGQDIAIEPVAPDVVYVPAYDPCWVYGPWWYPACSPLWFWYPDLVVGVGFFFGPPCFVGRLDGWSGFRWHRHAIFVNVGKAGGVGRLGVTRMHGGVEIWRHDPLHRRGVAYRSPAVARQFGQMSRPGVEARRSFRGFATQGAPPGGREGAQGFGRPGIAPRTLPQGQPRSEGSGGRTGGFGRPGTSLREGPGVQPRQFAPQPRAQESERPGAGISPPPVQSAPRFAEPRSSGAFEGFGQSRSEVQQHSERGWQSMGGPRGGEPGGGFRGQSFGGAGRSGGALGGGRGGNRGR